MPTYKTKGIILKRMNLGEADRILTLYTEKRGKVKAIAKGIRKPLSKLAGHLELFCLTNFMLAQGRNLDIVAEAQTIKCYIKLRDNLKETHAAYYLADVIDSMSPENEAHPEVFNLLESVLEHLDKKQEKLLISYFEINFLAMAGFKPELYQCVRCSEKIESKENYFSLEDGGVMCPKCQSNGAKISQEAIKILRLFLKHQISVVQRVKIKPALAQEIEDLSKKYLNYLSHRELKSQRFLE